MIKVNFNAYSSYVTDSIYQWDINRVLNVTGLNLSAAPEVHFSNANMDKAIVRQATLKNNVVTVSIPNSILQSPLTIYAHIGVYEGDTFKVIETVSIPVIPKVKPSDYRLENSDEEIYSFNRLESEFNNLNIHLASKDNPHNVNAEQVGALSLNGGTLRGDINFESGYGNNIHGDHNKPGGVYTGNGNATSRTIDIGGKGALLVITSDVGTALVTSRGAICHERTGTTVMGVVSWEVEFQNGKLKIATTNTLLNKDQQKYYYQVI